MKDSICKTCGSKDIYIRFREYSIGPRLKHICRTCKYTWNKKIKIEL